MVLAWCRVGVDATSRRRTDVYMAIFRCLDVESTRRIDVDATPFGHCVPGECIVSKCSCICKSLDLFFLTLFYHAL